VTRLTKPEILGLIYQKYLNQNLTSLILVLGYKYPLIQLLAMLMLHSIEFMLVSHFLPYDGEFGGTTNTVEINFGIL